jgi:hypothetical protein
MEGTRASRGAGRLCRESPLPLARASLGFAILAACRARLIRGLDGYAHIE